MSSGAPASFIYTGVQISRYSGIREQGLYRFPGEPRVLGTEQVFSVSVFQSQVGEGITEVSLIVDIGCILPLRIGIWAVGKGSCFPEPQRRLPGRGGPGLTDSSDVMLRALRYKRKSDFGPWCWVRVQRRTQDYRMEVGQGAALDPGGTPQTF